MINILFKRTKMPVSGFTLVELVMVMVIIGLLAAIIVPKFSSQRDQAAISTTKANLENLRTAIALFYAEEGEWPDDDLGDLADGTSPSTKKYMRAIPTDGVEKVNTVVNANDGNGGWHWDKVNYELLPNLSGNDANGNAYSGY